MMLLKGKVAIVTGASRGIGRAIAMRFASEGARVVITYIKDQRACDATVTAIKKLGGEAISIKADASEPADVEKLVATTVREFKGIDILVNNAGVSDITPFLETDESKWNKIIDIDLKGPFLCAKAVAKQMVKQRSGGRIINMSSISGMIAYSGTTPYSAAKAGIFGLTRGLAVDLAKHNITVNQISPGIIETDMTKDLIKDPKYLKVAIAALLVKRVGTPEDIAGAALFLAGPDSSFITGQNLVVDGGELANGD